MTLSRGRRLAAARWALPLCLAVFVVGIRWAALDRYGTDVPDWDQWDAEGINLLSPWSTGQLTVARLFMPHNEHRVVLTKLVNLGLTVANGGQWDQRLECAVNALFPALTAVGLFLLGRRCCAGPWQIPLLLVLVATFGLPVAWENEVAGFHSQQLFLIGLSLGAIAWLVDASPWSGRWWLGAGCMILALGSMASGFFAAAVVIVLLLVRAARGETSLRAAAPTLALGAGLVMLGGLTRVVVGHHEALKARSIDDFVLTASHALQWPTAGIAWTPLMAALWLPWAWLVWRMLVGTPRQRPGRQQAGGYVLAGLGAWVILQILATAYARGSGGPFPASRYVDTLAFGAVVNALAWGWLRESGADRPLLIAAGGGWALVFGVGLCFHLEQIYTADLPLEITDNYYKQENLRNYLATGDIAYLRHDEIPYLDPVSLVVHLDYPGLRQAMPVSVRLPLPLKPTAASSSFVAFDSRGPERHASRAASGFRNAKAAAPKPTGEGGHTVAEPAGVPSTPRGLSPATPTLANRVTWGDYGARTPGEWSSQPLRSVFGGWLKFEVAGQIGETDAMLELRDAVTQKRLAQVRADRIPGESWRSAYVRAPARAFVIVAHGEDARHWFAFSEPVEMGGLSYWAWRLTRHGLPLAELATGAALLLGAAACLPASRTPR